MGYVILFSLIGGLFSLIGALILFRDEKEAKKITRYATPFAAGVLLGAAFGDLLPEAVKVGDNTRLILVFALLAFLGFFLLEKFMHFFHHHGEHKGDKKAKSSMIIIGDTLHNALDGIAIGAAFLIDVPTGIIATLAVAAHEIPQEIGDFGLLIRNGMKRNKVIVVNILSAFATTITAVITFVIGDSDSAIVPFLLAITAGFFIYIAASDIIPEIHKDKPKNGMDARPWILLAGAVMILIISPIAHEYIDAGHDHDYGEEHSSEKHDEHEHEDDEEHEEHDDEHEEEHSE